MLDKAAPLASLILPTHDHPHFDRYIWKQVFSATLTGVMVLSGVMVLGNVSEKLDQLLATRICR